MDIINSLYKPTDIITFHDPLAATTIFNDEICSFRKGNVDVEIDGKHGEGFTAWKEDQTGGFHEVAAEVNVQNFFTEYFSVF
jgi:purine nucleosidase